MIRRRPGMSAVAFGRRLRAIPHRRGFGTLDYNDLIAQAGLQNCNPMDSACVSNNVAKQAAVEDFWSAHQGGVPDDTRLTFTPQTTQEVQEFYNPQNLAYGGNVVDTRGVMFVSAPDLPMTQTPKVNVTPAPVITKPAPTPPAAQPSPGTPGGAAVINSSGVVQPSSSSAAGAVASVSLPVIGGFDLNSIPWWGWGIAAGAALYAFGGHRGR